MSGTFFCEACGAEVKGRAESCPSCGRSFLGVRCPRCGKEGSAEVFKGGCPVCGYMEDKKTGRISSSGTSEPSAAEDWPVRRHYRNHRDWPASRYWILSAMVVVGVGLILYFWLR